MEPITTNANCAAQLKCIEALPASVSWGLVASPLVKKYLLVSANGHFIYYGSSG